MSTLEKYRNGFLKAEQDCRELQAQLQTKDARIRELEGRYNKELGYFSIEGVRYYPMDLSLKDRVKELEKRVNDYSERVKLRDMNRAGLYDKIKELKGEIEKLKKSKNELWESAKALSRTDLETLTAQVELLTKCRLIFKEANRTCITENIYNKCQPCKNKQAIENYFTDRPEVKALLEKDK